MKKLVLSFISTMLGLTCLSDEKASHDQKIQELRHNIEERLEDIPTRTTFAILKTLQNCVRKGTECDELKANSNFLTAFWEKTAVEDQEMWEKELKLTKEIWNDDKATPEETVSAIKILEIHRNMLEPMRKKIFLAIKEVDALVSQLIEEKQKEKAK